MGWSNKHEDFEIAVLTEETWSFTRFEHEDFYILHGFILQIYEHKKGKNKSMLQTGEHMEVS